MSMDLFLVRHGKSLHNTHNQFTGWVDSALSDAGIEEALEAGRILRSTGVVFEAAHTSVLKRSIATLDIILSEASQTWVPVIKSWLLNERHYGALEGVKKAQAQEMFGKERVHYWRRSYDGRPPALAKTDERYIAIRNDPRYAGLSDGEIPQTESLADTLERLAPYFYADIRPVLALKKKVLIVAHGNVIRAIRKVMEGISDEDVSGLEVPTGVPFVYELGANLKPNRKYYLGDPDKVERAVRHAAA